MAIGSVSVVKLIILPHKIIFLFKLHFCCFCYAPCSSKQLAIGFPLPQWINSGINCYVRPLFCYSVILWPVRLSRKVLKVGAKKWHFLSWTFSNMLYFLSSNSTICIFTSTTRNCRIIHSVRFFSNLQSITLYYSSD